MSSTNKTTNYDLSQFVGTDIPSILNDYNGDMRKIDTALGEINASAGESASSIVALNAKINTESARITSLNESLNTTNANLAIVSNEVTDIKSVIPTNVLNISANTYDNDADVCTAIRNAIENSGRDIRNSYILTPNGKLSYTESYQYSYFYNIFTPTSIDPEIGIGCYTMDISENIHEETFVYITANENDGNTIAHGSKMSIHGQSLRVFI